MNEYLCLEKVFTRITHTQKKSTLYLTDDQLLFKNPRQLKSVEIADIIGMPNGVCRLLPAAFNSFKI